MMAQKDKIKWNNKYKDNPVLLEQRDPSGKLIKCVEINKEKNKALDIACGTGRNSIYLANNNYKVDALDISDIVIEHLDNMNIKNIRAQVVDLEDINIKEYEYDLIVVCNYLDRKLFPKLINALNKNGLLLIETYMNHESNTKSSFNPKFLLEKDELKNLINDKVELIEYDEFDNESYEIHRMKKQSIILRRKV